MPMPVKADATIRPSDISVAQRWLESAYGVDVYICWMTDHHRKECGFTIAIEARQPGSERYTEPTTVCYTPWPSVDHKTVLGAILCGLYDLENHLAAAKHLHEVLAKASR